jgi:hypothetical protein
MEMIGKSVAAVDRFNEIQRASGEKHFGGRHVSAENIPELAETRVKKAKMGGEGNVSLNDFAFDPGKRRKLFQQFRIFD